MKKTVFIFGAGASIDAGLPSQCQLLKTYFQKREKDSFSPILDPYFKDFFNINLDNVNVERIPVFEEAVGVVELAIEKEETFGPDYPIEQLKKIKQALILSMGIAIEKCPLNAHNSYDTLISRLFHMGHFLKDEYSFINFNYDILLDKALLKLLNKKIYIDYGISFANEEIARGGFGIWRRPSKDRSLKYLKPHGSFNWMCCSTCNSIYIIGKGKEKSRVFTTGYLHNVERCPNDQTELYCPIEPPSFFKKYKNIYLQNIWKDAYNLIKEAERLVFVGYSLQEADIWVKYLLKRCCFACKKDIIVVNMEEEGKLKSKYERLFGEVKYCQIPFREFANNHKKFLS